MKQGVLCSIWTIPESKKGTTNNYAKIITKVGTAPLVLDISPLRERF